MSEEKQNGLEIFDRFRKYHRSLNEMTEEEFNMVREDIRMRTLSLLSTYSNLTKGVNDEKLKSIDEAFAYVLDLIVLMGGNLEGLSIDIDPSMLNPIDSMYKDFIKPLPEEFKNSVYNEQGKYIFNGIIYFKVMSFPEVKFTDKGKSGRNYYITKAIVEIKVPKDSKEYFADSRALLTIIDPTEDTVKSSLYVPKIAKNHIYSTYKPSCQLQTPENAKFLSPWDVKWECSINTRNIEDKGEDIDLRF